MPGRRALQIGQDALAADHLGLGVLADGAGVDDDKAGVLHGVGARAAGGEELPGHLLGVALVHLAAEGPDEEARQAVLVGPELGRAGIDLRRHGQPSGRGSRG